MAGVTNEIISEARRVADPFGIALIQQDEAFFTHLLGRQVSLEQVPEELLTWRPRPGTRTFVSLESNHENL